SELFQTACAARRSSRTVCASHPCASRAAAGAGTVVRSGCYLGQPGVRRRGGRGGRLRSARAWPACLESGHRARPSGFDRSDGVDCSHHTIREPRGRPLERDSMEAGMSAVRYFAGGLLLVILLASLCPRLLTHASYESQFRESANAPASKEFPLGTDELGRD